MLESLFNEVAGPQASFFIKKRISFEYCEILKNSFFHRTPPVIRAVNYTTLKALQHTYKVICEKHRNFKYQYFVQIS